LGYKYLIYQKQRASTGINYKETQTMTAKKTPAKKKASKLPMRVAEPSHAVLEVRIKNTQGSTLIMESKMGTEDLKNQQGTSMDPTVKAGMLAERPGGKLSAKSIPRTEAVLRQEAEHCIYYEAGKKNSFGLPASGFKKSMIELAKNKANEGIDGAHIHRNIWVLADCKSKYGEDLVRIKCSAPHPQRDMGINSGMTGAPRVISRAEVDKWEAQLRIKFNRNAFSPEEVLNLVLMCGSEDGFGGKRIGKCYGHGGYSVASEPAPRTTNLKFKKLTIL
jgi:hypothetical protein